LLKIVIEEIKLKAV